MTDRVVTPVLQFGTSRFLQAHADLFFSEGDPPLAVTVVQSTGDASRAERLAALARPGGYPVRIRGLASGKVIDEERRVTSVRRTLSTAQNWETVERIAAGEARFIISNTADAGYAPQPLDHAARPDQTMSYPAKLSHLLEARHRAGGRPVTMLPMELVPRNGEVLAQRVFAIARARGADSAFLDYLRGGVVWASSLVDRIVSEAIEPAGAVAEPYALWAIEAAPGVSLPTSHPALQLVPDLEELERLKLHILNLGHTALADVWRRAGQPGGRLVRQMMADPAARDELDAIYTEEVLPGFEARGYGPETAKYRVATVERFENPFLDHRVADIAQNHDQKAQRRIGRFIEWVEAAATGPRMPRLRAILARARS